MTFLVILMFLYNEVFGNWLDHQTRQGGIPFFFVGEKIDPCLEFPDLCDIVSLSNVLDYHEEAI